jgi:hypothetical protein
VVERGVLLMQRSKGANCRRTTLLRNMYVISKGCSSRGVQRRIQKSRRTMVKHKPLKYHYKILKRGESPMIMGFFFVYGA